MATSRITRFATSRFFRNIPRVRFMSTSTNNTLNATVAENKNNNRVLKIAGAFATVGMLGYGLYRYKACRTKTPMLEPVIEQPPLGPVIEQTSKVGELTPEQKLFCEDCIKVAFQNKFNGVIDSHCLTQKKANEIVMAEPASIANIPLEFRTQEMYNDAIKKNISIITHVPLENKTDDFYHNFLNSLLACSPTYNITAYLRLIPERFITEDHMVSIIGARIKNSAYSEALFKAMPDKYKTYIVLSNLIGNKKISFTHYYGGKRPTNAELLDIMSNKTGISVNVLECLVLTQKIELNTF